eukprot:SAG11_NODE_1913_length_4076_cov_10.003520_1_plen_190_part_00
MYLVPRYRTGCTDVRTRRYGKAKTYLQDLQNRGDRFGENRTDRFGENTTAALEKIRHAEFWQGCNAQMFHSCMYLKMVSERLINYFIPEFAMAYGKRYGISGIVMVLDFGDDTLPHGRCHNPKNISIHYDHVEATRKSLLRGRHWDKDRKTKKPRTRFYGPFKILDQLGPVSYQLQVLTLTPVISPPHF